MAELQDFSDLEGFFDTDRPCNGFRRHLDE